MFHFFNLLLLRQLLNVTTNVSFFQSFVMTSVTHSYYIFVFFQSFVITSVTHSYH